jgi:hypothetical protein
MISLGEIDRIEPTRKGLAAYGVSWPPPKNWKNLVAATGGWFCQYHEKRFPDEKPYFPETEIPHTVKRFLKGPNQGDTYFVCDRCIEIYKDEQGFNEPKSRPVEPGRKPVEPQMPLFDLTQEPYLWESDGKVWIVTRWRQDPDSVEREPLATLNVTNEFEQIVERRRGALGPNPFA